MAPIPTTDIAIGDLIFARHGCTCNPQIHQIQQNHVCLPLRQIAMAFHRLDPAPFMPVPITENVLGHLLHSTIPRDSRFALIQLFGERRFSDMWTLPQVRQMLSTACLMCGHAQELDCFADISTRPTCALTNSWSSTWKH